MTKIGRHIKVATCFELLPSYAKSFGYDCFQIFLGSPEQIITKSKTKKELEQFSDNLIKEDMHVVIHGKYTINFCHPIGSTKSNTSIKSLIQDLNASHIIGPNCMGVIIHMGKNIKDNNLPAETAINNYIATLKLVLEDTPDDTIIILETGASQGTEVGSRLTSLAKIYNGLEVDEQARIFFCIDTCHIWATGYDISTKAGVINFFERFDQKIGIDKIICIHFNNSKTDINSHVDRHADLTHGMIDTSGLKEIAKFAKRNDIPLIMETPLSHNTLESELKKVKSWMK